MHKIIFMGTPSFSVPILQALIEEETIEIIAVVDECNLKANDIVYFAPNFEKIHLFDKDTEITLGYPQELEEK